MASLKKMRGNWYSRIRGTDKYGKRYEKLIPLRTASKTEAHIRNVKVNKREEDIKTGIEFKFPWLKAKGGHTTVKLLTLSDGVSSWLERREKSLKVGPSTIAINKNGISHLYNCIDEEIPLKSIQTSHTDEFVDYLIDLELAPSSVNMHIRTVNALLRYHLKRGNIEELPILEEITVGDSLPIYITDDEFQAIMELDWLDSFYKKVFFFFRETGLRLREPFIAKLDGIWLDIPNSSKGKRPRSIELNDSLIEVFRELIDWSETCGLVERSKGVHLSKMFKKALRKCDVDESKHFHSLRHTFAVRKLVMGVPLAIIQAELGHRNQSTTEIYTKFKLKRLRRDFPTLVSTSENVKIESRRVPLIWKGDTVIGDTGLVYGGLVRG